MGLIDGVLDKTYPGLIKQMDLCLKRNEAIVSNITNAETPQYRAVDLNFAGELERAFSAGTEVLKTTNPSHMDISSAGGAHYVQDFSGATKPDGNNVDLDIQMGQIAYNSGKYTGAATLLRKKLTMLKNVIREARN